MASDDDIENSPHRGPRDQSEGEVTDGEADPVDSGLPTLEQLKMSKEEQQDYDAFSHGGFQDFGYLDPFRPQAPHQLPGAQGGYLRPTALGSSAAGPPGHDRHGQFDSGFIYQQAGRDSLRFPATSDCRAFPLVRVTRHSSPGETHSRLHERDSRPPISSESVNTDRVVPAPRDRETHLQGLGDTRSRHVCDTVELPPSSVHVSSSGAKSPSGGCSVSGLAG